MVKEVQLPDGSIAEFPDDISEEQISQILRQQFPTQDQITAPTQQQQIVPGPQEDIRSRRATEDQPALPPLEVDPTDPLTPVFEDPRPGLVSGLRRQPIDIGTRSLLEGPGGFKDVEDFNEQKMRLAGVAGREDALREGGNILEQFAKSQVGAGARALAPFGLGDFFRAAGQALSTDLSPDEALEYQREFRKVLEEKFPLTTLGASIIGDVAGGGLTLKALKQAGKGTKAGQLLDSLTTFGKGIKGNIANAFKASAIGAPIAATVAAIRGEDPIEGATFGAIGGPLGVAFAKTVGVTVGALKFGLGQVSRLVPGDFRKFFDDPAAKAWRFMAKKLDIPEKEFLDDILKFKTATGRTPSIAEASNSAVRAELNAAIGASTGASQIARETAEEILERRPGEVVEQVTRGRVTVTQAAEEAKRTRVAERQFAEAEKDAIIFPADDVQNLLNDPDLRRAIPASLRRRLDAAQEGIPEGQPVTLQGAEVNDLRLALRDRARGATGADRIFGELANEVEDIARTQSKAFGRAIDEFRRRSVRIEGLAAGERVFAPRTTKEIEQAAIEAAEDPSLAAGLRVGARGAVEETVGERAGTTLQVLKNINENVGLVRRLKALLPEREVEQLQKVARTQAKAIEGIAETVPGVKINKDVQKAVEGAINTTVLVSTGTSTASKVFAFGRLLRNLGTGLDDRVIRNLARDAFDPKKTQKVLGALRRRELGEDEILDLFLSSVTAAGQAGRLPEGEQIER